MKAVEPGIYRHYKGRHYLVIGMARNDATNEQMVLYVPLYVVDHKQQMTVRTLENFTEKILGETLRFTRLEEDLD